MVEAWMERDGEGRVMGVIRVEMGSFMGLKRVGEGTFGCWDGAEFEEICWESGFVQRKPPRRVIRRVFGGSDIAVAGRVDWERCGTLEFRDRVLGFQRAAVERCVGMGRALLAGDMGVGKTWIASAYVWAKGGRTLVLFPASVRSGWWKTLTKTMGLTNVYNLTEGSQRVPDGEVVVLCSYDLAKDHDGVRSGAWETVVADESHAFANGESGRTSRLMPLCKAARNLLLLSGTPEKARPMELFAQLTMLDDDLICEEEYAERYCAGFVNDWGDVDTRGNSNEKELHLLLSLYMIRIRSEDVLPHLPPMTRTMVPLRVDLTRLDEMRAEERLLQNQFLTAQGRYKKLRQRAVFAQRLRMWRETGRAKTEEGIRWFLDQYGAEEGRKWVVFARHKEVFKGVSKSLRGAGIPFVQIDGAVKGSKRQDLVDCIADPSRPERVALLTLGTCATGITLCPGATRMVIFELIHTPDILDQAEKRIHRIGCVEPVTVYWLVGQGTMDAHILHTIRRKQEVNSSIIDGTDSA